MIAAIRKRSDKSAHEQGFTLIELLIVIVILGILAAIVVFAIGKTRGDSVASACKTNFKSVELSAEAIKTKTGKYPAGQGDLVDGVVAGNGALLKVYPTSSDYSLVYASSATPPTTASTYTITVKDSTGATKGTDTTACDSL